MVSFYLKEAISIVEWLLPNLGQPGNSFKAPTARKWQSSEWPKVLVWLRTGRAKAPLGRAGRKPDGDGGSPPPVGLRAAVVAALSELLEERRGKEGGAKSYAAPHPPFLRTSHRKS